MAPETKTETQSPKGGRPIVITDRIFDLISKDEVVVQKTGTHEPVKDMEDFVRRLGNDSKLILELCDQAIENYEEKQLRADVSKPWQTLDDEGNVVGDFEGQPIAENKVDSFQKTVLQIAKMQFGYPDGRLPKTATKAERDAAKATKIAARDAAISFLLSLPQTVEALKG